MVNDSLFLLKIQILECRYREKPVSDPEVENETPAAVFPCLNDTFVTDLTVFIS